MMITERSKQVISFRPNDAKRVGDGCFYLDLIVWLNGDEIELGERVGFNYGCYVMIHTANHRFDRDRPILDQGWEKRPVEIGADCWIGMGVCILPGARLGDGCVVGAGSVVAGELGPNCVAVGNPARAIKSR